MSVNIQFSTDNNAFCNGNMESEIHNILEHIAHKIDQGYLKSAIRDVNGNQIGEFEVN